jgi:hypothetical protein
MPRFARGMTTRDPSDVGGSETMLLDGAFMQLFSLQ